MERVEEGRLGGLYFFFINSAHSRNTRLKEFVFLPLNVSRDELRDFMDARSVQVAWQ